MNQKQKGMKCTLNKIIEKIECDKEVLSTLPKNNKKNLSKYIEKVSEIKKEYSEYKYSILKEIEKRYNKIIKVKRDEEIDKLETQVKEIDKILDTIDEKKTSYEKMGLDKIIFKLGRFYKENLESINEEILSGINIFKEVGVVLTPNDFDYSIYVKQYMAVFFEEAKNGNINSNMVKSTFEEIYWKCPDIIIHIELNFRYIFIKNQSVIDKYYEKRQNELLNTIKMSKEQITEKYVELKKQLLMKEIMDKSTIVEKFMSGEYNTKDYTDEKIKSYYETIFLAKELKKENRKELDENIIKFINSLYEFKNYMKFQFIFADIKEKFKNKEQHKNDYNSIKKEIASKEKKLYSLNKKINGKGLFGKKKEKNESKNVEYNKLILEIKDSYRRFDEAEIYRKITENLSEESSIYDVLNVSSKFRNYLVDCMIKNDKNIELSQIELDIEELKRFLKNPYTTIIKNISINEDKDIPIIISDRYKLLNFKIKKEDINIDNVDSIIDILNKIEIRHNMDFSGISIKDMEFISECKKILNK